MEIIGKIYKAMPIFTGTGRNGEWKKREFVIETEENFPKKVHFTLFGDALVNVLDGIALGDQVKVYFNPESREWNERWYTDLRCFRLDKISTQQLTSAPSAPSATPEATYTTPEAQPAAEMPPAVAEDDDLPF